MAAEQGHPQTQAKLPISGMEYFAMRGEWQCIVQNTHASLRSQSIHDCIFNVCAELIPNPVYSILASQAGQKSLTKNQRFFYLSLYDYRMHGWEGR